MEGKIVNRIPPAKNTEYDWDSAALLALEHPDGAVLAAEHVPMSRINSLRGYNRPPFVDSHGNRRVIVRMRNSVIEHGRRYGDVYLQASNN